MGNPIAKIMVLTSILVLCCSIRMLTALDVEIQSTLFFDRPLINSLEWTGAPLDVAVQVVNERNNEGLNVAVTQIEKVLYENCSEIFFDAAVYQAEYYYKYYLPEKCIAFLGSACGDTTGIAKIARELNAVFFVNTFPTPELPNYQLYNTTFLFGPNHETVAAALVALLLHYKWYHVTAILDVTAFAPMYKNGLGRTQKLWEANPVFDWEVIRIDAKKSDAARAALIAASRRSRVILLLAQVSLTLRMLKIASDLGMANGEYVFLTPQGNPVQPYGIVAMLNYPDASMWNITRTVIYLTLSQVSRGGEDIQQRARVLALQKYNTTYSAENPLTNNYVIQGTMDAVEVLAATIIEARKDGHAEEDLCSASTLVPYIRNRTFHLSRGTIHVTYDHKVRIDVMYFAFDVETKRMKVGEAIELSCVETRSFELSMVAGIYYDYESRMEITSDTFPNWVAGSPPLDIPPCGFLGNLGPCAPTPVYQRMEIAVPVCIVLTALIVVALWKWQTNSVLGVMLRKRWLIAPGELNPLSATTVRMGSGQSTWKGLPVWLTCIARPEKVDLNACSRMLIFLQQTNVAKYYGFCLYPGHLAVISEYCSKGSLTNLLRNTHLELDFKLSFAVDLVQGLRFLHSVAGPHGQLTVFCCLIDGYFTLKIAKYGLFELRNHLGHAQKSEKPSYWKAPEFLKNETKKSVPGDIFSFGLILASMFVDPESNLSQHHGIETTMQSSCPPQLRPLIEECLSPDPQTRPKLRQIIKDLTKVFPQRNLGRTGVAERIIARFTLHTAMLEDAATERTAALQQEQAKCDALLRELLPQFVVEKLRNRQAVEASIYDSVTIYFSRLEGFAYWTAQVSPGMVLRILTKLDLTFDKKIADYAVRKVESVGDCYMVVGGIPEISERVHSHDICAMALGLQKHFGTTAYSNNFKLRCGVHTGSCAAGVIGSKVPRFCLFGDAVNVASRIETNGAGGRIHLSQETALLVEGVPPFHVQERGLVELKGKGLVRTFWVEDANDHVKEYGFAG